MKNWGIRKLTKITTTKEYQEALSQIDCICGIPGCYVDGKILTYLEFLCREVNRYEGDHAEDSNPSDSDIIKSITELAGYEQG